MCDFCNKAKPKKWDMWIDKIWIMMKYGYANKFDPNRVTVAEINELYKREHNLQTIIANGTCV